MLVKKFSRFATVATLLSSILLSSSCFARDKASEKATEKANDTNGTTNSSSKKGETFESESHKFMLQTLLQQNDVVWGFDFLSDGRILFSERKGALRVYDPKTKSVQDIKGVPRVWAEGQGGLLDVRVHPTQKDQIFLTYSEPVGDGATTALGKATLSQAELTQFKKLFSATAANSNDLHFGSRIEFDGQGSVFITVGDRNERAKVQDLSSHIGKLIRLKEDGSVPNDNPFVGQKGAQPEIWSIGHRSPQGLVRDSVSGTLWLAEMGPRGGDEVNLVKRGANYGWPVVTYGREYYGPKIGEGSEKKGMEQPVVHWVPSISPSGITVYSGDVFPKWKGNIFVGTLSGAHLRRLEINAQKVTKQEVLLKDLGMRIRNVRTGPDGFLYLSTDDGKIARLTPAGL